MYQGRFGRVWGTIVVLQLIGALGSNLFYWVQENFYGEQNVLKPLYDFLGDFQISMTSYFIVLSMTGLGMMLLLFALRVMELTYKRIALAGLYLVPVAGAIVYTLYEVHQAANPTYPDNFFLDAVLAWLACMTFIIGVTWANKPVR